MATAEKTGPTLTVERIASLDVFRGLTMLLMLLTNDIGDADLGHIANVPQWLRHMPRAVEGMTMPDVIWPCFMFIVGLSIPLALERRIARGDSTLKLARHIVGRSTALIFIGLCMVNGNPLVPLDETAMGVSGPVWRLLMYLGLVLAWNGYPRAEGPKRWLFAALQLGGTALLAYLLFIYRAQEGDHSIWFRTRWWGIIGLIGWAYLLCAFLWLACRNNYAAVMGAMALFMALDIATQSGQLDAALKNLTYGFAPKLNELSWLCAMTAAGMAVGTLFLPGITAPTPGESKGTVPTPGARIAWMLVYAVALAAAGALLRPIWGIHKLAGTPSWILFSLAVAAAVYAFLYWLIDVKGLRRWTLLVEPAGSNTLLMYFLPHIFYALLAAAGIDFLQTHLCAGWPGVARSAALALCFLAITAGLTRLRIRLKL